MAIQAMLDRFAIGLSVLCAIHCVLGSALLIAFPLLTFLSLGHQEFHQFSLYLVVPVSVVALALGYFRHKRLQSGLYGAAGVALFAVTALWGHDLFGHDGEVYVAVFAGALIAYAHWLNYKLLHRHQQHLA